jgi:hypothetical protein
VCRARDASDSSSKTLGCTGPKHDDIDHRAAATAMLASLIASLRHSKPVTSTRLPCPGFCGEDVRCSDVQLRDAPQRDDREMLPIAATRDAQLEHGTGTSPHERLHAGAARSLGPSRRGVRCDALRSPEAILVTIHRLVDSRRCNLMVGLELSRWLSAC